MSPVSGFRSDILLDGFTPNSSSRESDGHLLSSLLRLVSTSWIDRRAPLNGNKQSTSARDHVQYSGNVGRQYPPEGKVPSPCSFTPEDFRYGPHSSCLPSGSATSSSSPSTTSSSMEPNTNSSTSSTAIVSPSFSDSSTTSPSLSTLLTSESTSASSSVLASSSSSHTETGSVDLSSHPSSKLNRGAIIGIAIGSFFLVAFLLFTFFLLRWRRRRRKSKTAPSAEFLNASAREQFRPILQTRNLTLNSEKNPNGLLPNRDSNGMMMAEPYQPPPPIYVGDNTGTTEGETGAEAEGVTTRTMSLSPPPFGGRELNDGHTDGGAGPWVGGLPLEEGSIQQYQEYQEPLNHSVHPDFDLVPVRRGSEGTISVSGGTIEESVGDHGVEARATSPGRRLLAALSTSSMTPILDTSVRSSRFIDGQAYFDGDPGGLTDSSGNHAWNGSHGETTSKQWGTFKPNR